MTALSRRQFVQGVGVAGPALPLLSAQTRAELRRHEQRQLLEAYLRTLPHEDAASVGTVSPHLDRTRGPKPQPWAPYERHVDGRLSLFPLHVLVHIHTALALLPWPQHQVLRLCLILDQSQVDVALLLRRSPRWVRWTKARALTALAELLWTHDGHPRVPAEARRRGR